MSIGTLGRPQSSIPARTRRQELQQVQISRAPVRIEKTATDGCHLLAKLGVAGRGEAAVIARQAKNALQRGAEWLWAAWL